MLRILPIYIPWIATVAFVLSSRASGLIVRSRLPHASPRLSLKHWLSRKCFLSDLIRISSHHRIQTIMAASNYEHNIDVEDEEEEQNSMEGVITEKPVLATLKYKNVEAREIKNWEESGTLELQPFYQREYKWSQKDASLYIESILTGFPCVPEIILLETKDDEVVNCYTTFDGQQRLSTVINFMKGVRSNKWRPTKKQQGEKNDNFPLKGLTDLPDLEGMTFKDLSKKDQNEIAQYDFRVAVIPSSWPMKQCLNFFKRIQGGGTPMTEHELRRAISMGPFTEMLDSLAKKEQLRSLFPESMGRDKLQELLLKYFILITFDKSKYGKPSLSEQCTDVMKHWNAKMKLMSVVDFEAQRTELEEPLMDSISLLREIFPNDELFRRVEPLVVKGKVRSPGRLWKSNNINPAIFVCMAFCFSHQHIRGRLRRLLNTSGNDSSLSALSELRTELLTLMQTDPDFTDSLNAGTTSNRISKTESSILSVLDRYEDPKRKSISNQTRSDLIKNARASNAPCNLCGKPLGQYDEHLHIDHIKPVSKGGNNQLNNLQVVHKTCNLKKSNKEEMPSSHVSQ